MLNLAHESKDKSGAKLKTCSNGLGEKQGEGENKPNTRSRSNDKTGAEEEKKQEAKKLNAVYSSMIKSYIKSMTGFYSLVDLLIPIVATF